MYSYISKKFTADGSENRRNLSYVKYEENYIEKKKKTQRFTMGKAFMNVTSEIK